MTFFVCCENGDWLVKALKLSLAYDRRKVFFDINIVLHAFRKGRRIDIYVLDSTKM